MSAILDLALVLAVAIGILRLAVKVFQRLCLEASCFLEDRWYLMSVKMAAGKWAPLVSDVYPYSGTVKLDRLATKCMSVDEMREMATALQNRLHPDSAVRVSESDGNVAIEFFRNNSAIPSIWVELPAGNPTPVPVSSSFETKTVPESPFPQKP